MATVCGAALSLMDAGVPWKAPVAGVAMGLVKEGDAYVILTDIAGAEDHYGDMDFKVAGTRDGITALQMDIKVAGITSQIMREALAQAQRGRLHILDKMSEVDEHRIKDIKDELKEGDQVLVKVLAVEGNRIKLSRMAILKEQRAKMGGAPPPDMEGHAPEAGFAPSAPVSHGEPTAVIEG